MTDITNPNCKSLDVSLAGTDFSTLGHLKSCRRRVEHASQRRLELESHSPIVSQMPPSKKSKRKQPEVVTLQKRTKNHRTKENVDEDDHDEEYIVSKIIATKVDQALGGRVYQVRWKGFRPDQAPSNAVHHAT